MKEFRVRFMNLGGEDVHWCLWHRMWGSTDNAGLLIVAQGYGKGTIRFSGGAGASVHLELTKHELEQFPEIVLRLMEPVG